MARPRTPNAILIANGSKHARDNEPTVEGGLGDPPDELNEAESKLWVETADIMEELGISSRADRGTLKEYVRAMVQADEAAKIVEREGMIAMTERGLTKHPAVTIQNTASVRAKAYATELGLSPISRGKLSVKPKEKASPLAEFRKVAQ